MTGIRTSACMMIVILSFLASCKTAALNGMLIDSLKKGNLAGARKALDEGAQVNLRMGKNRDSLLHQSAREGNRAMAELLIARGADVNAGDASGWAPLHIAVKGGYTDMVSLLIAGGADVNAGNSSQSGAPGRANDGAAVVSLHRSVITGADSGKMMKEISAGPYRVDGRITGYKLFGLAENNYLYKFGARKGDILRKYNDKPITGQSDLIGLLNAMKRDDRVVVEAERGGAVITYIFNIYDHYGWTPLHMAARYNRMEAAKLLLEKGARRNAASFLTLDSFPAGVIPADVARLSGNKGIGGMLR